MNETYIPAVITASVALIAAVGAQLLGNWLALRRDKKNYLKVCYQNLFGPIYFRLWKVVMVGHPDYYRLGYEEEFGYIEEEWKEILQIFGENKQYASAELMETYFEINQESRHDHERIYFALFFFRELDLIMDSLKIKSPRRKNLKILINSLEIWETLWLQFNENIANLSLIYIDVLPEDFSKKTKKFMKKNDPGETRTVTDDFVVMYPYFKRHFFDKLVDLKEYEKEYIKYYEELYKEIQEKKKN